MVYSSALRTRTSGIAQIRYHTHLFAVWGQLPCLNQIERDFVWIYSIIDDCGFYKLPTICSQFCRGGLSSPAGCRAEKRLLIETHFFDEGEIPCRGPLDRQGSTCRYQYHHFRCPFTMLAFVQVNKP